MIGEITPPQAMHMIQEQDAILLDVRSQMEFDYVGHPPDAVHVALQEPPGWGNDPAFVDRVAALLPDRDTPILTMCRSGKRSLQAAELLVDRGYTNVFNVREGFEGDLDADRHRGNINGWRFHGLPWEQT